MLVRIGKIISQRTRVLADLGGVPGMLRVCFQAFQAGDEPND
jgi:hypothetical protein